MAKEVIITGKYRLHEGATPHRIRLVYIKDHRKEGSQPQLELYDGKDEPIATYHLSKKSNNPIENPENPDFLRSSLKDLSRKLTDSGVYPPGFFEELNQRLRNNNWDPEQKQPKSF